MSPVLVEPSPYLAIGLFIYIYFKFLVTGCHCAFARCDVAAHD
jgi:hypothetical protein